MSVGFSDGKEGALIRARNDDELTPVRKPGKPGKDRSSTSSVTSGGNNTSGDRPIVEDASSTPFVETVQLGPEAELPVQARQGLAEDAEVEATVNYPNDLPSDEPRVVAEEEINAELEREIAMLQVVPRINIGALFMPPIWGPAHGMWLTILFYPLWLLADNCFYAAYAEPSPLSIVIAISVGILLVVGTFLFAGIAQHKGVHRAVSEKNMTVEAYRRAERIWAVVSIIIALVALVFATWFNLSGLRGGIG